MPYVMGHPTYYILILILLGEGIRKAGSFLTVSPILRVLGAKNGRVESHCN